MMLKKRTAACSMMRSFSFLFLLEQDGENDINRVKNNQWKKYLISPVSKVARHQHPPGIHVDSLLGTLTTSQVTNTILHREEPGRS